MRSFSSELDFVLNCNTLLLLKSAYGRLEIESLLRILCLVVPVVPAVASPGMLVKISRCFMGLTVRHVARQTKGCVDIRRNAFFVFYVSSGDDHLPIQSWHIVS